MTTRHKQMPASRTRRALAEQARRDSRSVHPYDGVLGMPPTWMPSPLTREFVAVRDRLLDCHSVETVRTWFEAYRIMTAPITQARSIPRFPSEHEQALELLSYVFSLAEMGEEQGMQVYLGHETESALRRRAVQAANHSRQRAGGRRSATVRQKKMLARDLRVHAAARAGEPLKAVAQTEKVSLATISRAMKRSRK